MITWMQKHKKWLVITIWISTIAFVGAGFVGWGSYDYNQKGGVVAIVGDREVGLDEYQREYSALYEQYSQIFGGQFNQEMADQMKLRDTAYNLTIQKNLILSYADELGLDVTDEEIALELVKMRAFSKDGKFDKATYLKVLAQNATTAKDYESSLRRNLLLQKVQKLFIIAPQSVEVKALNQLMFAEDNVSLKVIDSNNIKVNVDMAELKKFWEPIKSNYMSSRAYELGIEKLEVTVKQHDDATMKSNFKKFKLDYKKADGKLKTFDEALVDIQAVLDAKVAKKEALKKYLKLKKGDEQFSNTAVIYEDRLTFSPETIEKIKKSKVGTVIKPVKAGGEFVTIKVINTFAPKVLTFEKAEKLVINDYIAKKRVELLEEKVIDTLTNFKDAKTVNLTRESNNKVPGLNPTDATNFLGQLFSTNKKEGSININEKTIVYKINSSTLASYDASKDEAVKSTLSQLQNNELMSNLVKRLEKSYEVQSTLDQKEK